MGRKKTGEKRDGKPPINIFGYATVWSNIMYKCWTALYT